MGKKLISIDLDGVLNEYDGDFDADKIPPIRNGAYEFIKNLSKDYRIEIFTTRERRVTKNWLKENNLQDFIENVTNMKNSFTSVFLDDRAINFSGDYQFAEDLIKQFRPYWKK